MVLACCLLNSENNAWSSWTCGSLAATAALMSADTRKETLSIAQPPPTPEPSAWFMFMSLRGKSGKESAHPWTRIEPSGRLPKLRPSPEDRKQSFILNFFSSWTRLSTPVCSDGRTDAT